MAPRITLNFELRGVSLANWNVSSLRLFLGDDYPQACDLYLLLMRYLKRSTSSSTRQNRSHAWTAASGKQYFSQEKWRGITQNTANSFLFIDSAILLG